MSAGDVQVPVATPAPLRVSEQTRTALGVVGAAATLGILGDALLRSAPWGLNLALWTVAMVVAIAALQRWTDADDAAVGWIPLALGAAALIAWRDSPTLKALDLAALGIILGLAMLRARGGQVRMAGLAHHAAGVAASAGDAAVGAAALLFRDVRWRELGSEGAARQGVAVLRGGALAVPLLLLFGGLLASADARFERLLGGLFGSDLSALLGHVTFALLVAWICGGILRTMTVGGDAPGPQFKRPESLSLGIVETGMVLGLLDLLFLAFVAVQLPYFFGSAEVVQGAGSTSFSDYARRGFFELVAVAGMVLPLLLFADWIVRRESRAHVRTFRWLAGAQVALLFVIMASALHRMRLYQGAYGLTELRLYTTAFMLWLGVVFAWFAWTVLRGSRERFAWGALTTALEALVILHVVNPDAAIVRANAARADAPLRFDAAYAASLSADAVPPLLAALPRVRPELRCLAAERLQARWARADADWRSWSLSRGRARGMVGSRVRDLRAMGPCPAPVVRAARVTGTSAGVSAAAAPPAAMPPILPRDDDPRYESPVVRRRRGRSTVGHFDHFIHQSRRRYIRGGGHGEPGGAAVSTLEREVMDADAAHPSTALALVPLAADWRAVEGVPLPRVQPGRAHVYFYALGYAGLGLIALAAWVGARSYEGMMMLNLAAAFCIGLGGLGVVVHVLYRPGMPKLRKGLGAVASLLLTVAAVPAMGRAAVEVYAASLVPRLQPLAEDLARDGRIREMERSNGDWRRLNGFAGPDAGPEVMNGRTPGQPYPLAFEDVLRRDGITRADRDAFERRMVAAGMDAVEVGEGYVAFRRDGIARWRLLHVLAGQPLPSRGTLLMGWPEWRLQPLGGGWYIVRGTGRRTRDRVG